MPSIDSREKRWSKKLYVNIKINWRNKLFLWNVSEFCIYFSSIIKYL